MPVKEVGRKRPDKSRARHRLKLAIPPHTVPTTRHEYERVPNLA
jgi:hypothetical protein